MLGAMKAMLLRGLAGAGLALWAGALWAQNSTITIIHTNDIHSRALPVKTGKIMAGGYARQAGMIEKLRAESTNPIVLNAGDSFQGTIYFSVYEGLAEAAFMNLAGYQAMCLGNHEFDKGPAVLGRFLDQVQFPVLAANIDVSAEPALKGKVKPSAIHTVNGQKVGLVGAVTPETPNISSPGDTVKWLDLADSIQKQVDLLTVQGISRIVLLSHCGYDEDKALAPKLRGVDVIVGGHSHTPLGDLGIPGYERTSGPYPTQAKGADGKPVLIVQAWEWGKVVGSLEVTFDYQGVIQSFKGAPHVVDEKSPVDAKVESVVTALGKPVETLVSQKVGTADIDLDRGGAGRENLMGYVVADAQLAYLKDKGAVAAFMNPGGVRRNLSSGPVTYGDVIEVQPFSNTLVLMELTGAEIRKALEDGLANHRMLLPSAGTSYTASQGKVKDLVVAGAPVDDAKVYKVVVNSFMAGGGDALFTLRDAKGARTDTGFLDLDALIDWFRRNTPVKQVSGGRVKSEG